MMFADTIAAKGDKFGLVRAKKPPIRFAGIESTDKAAIYRALVIESWFNKRVN